MTREEVTKILTDIFRDIFEEDNLIVTDETTAGDIEAWDSLTHLSMISEVESKFRIRFKMKEITTMKNVGEMITIICERAK